MVRKIVQIITGNAQDYETSNQHILYALCDDGTVWCNTNIFGDWESLKKIPQD